MMQKLQPLGDYKLFSDAAYDKVLKATAVVKIVLANMSCKFKFGQHLSDERFEMTIRHLQERDTKIDLATIAIMKTQKEQNHGI